MLKDRVGDPLNTSGRVDGEKLDSGIPEYLVRPSVYPLSVSSLPDSVKIVDYGESFFDTEPPATLHTPLAVRAPEIVFGDRFDHHVDLWSMACLVCIFGTQGSLDMVQQESC
jgi:serine/threonine protein kinase